MKKIREAYFRRCVADFRRFDPVMNFMIATVNGCIENLYRFTEAMFGAGRN